MKIQAGYVYHISDVYFKKVNEPNLMQNKEGGTFRPTFYCIKDEQTNLLWMVPMSTRYEKYSSLAKKQTEKYGKCLGIVLGKYDGKNAAFLLQNMFPVTEKYLSHIHTRNGNPVPVSHKICQEINTNMKILKNLLKKGKKVVFPDVERLENIMLKELSDNL